ncbi:MAG: M81 family metallopeptidase [Planctomycetes bacterium]|nr:M81 family metallopeptidase [Planctomycetota bacterium]
MRIAIGQLWQETNTLNPLPTTLTEFEAFGVFEGAALIDQFAETNELGGFIQSLRAWPEQPEIIGLMRFAAWPSGPVDAATFHALIARTVDALQRAGRVDAVLLALHGSLVAECEADVEGHLLQRVRALIGPKIPLVATLDLHANVTRRMVDNADVLTLYHTAPHIDVMGTGRRGAAALRRMMIDGAKPVTAFRKLPLVVPAERANTQDPTSFSYGVRKTLEGWERNRHVLSAGLATVQPWLDIPDLGSSVLVIVDGDAWKSWSEEACANLANEVWTHRRDYLPELVDAAAAVRAAFVGHVSNVPARHDGQVENVPHGLTVISDSADATTSGSTGDSTVLLSELIKYDWPRPALVTLVGPETVVEAERRGVGADWTSSLGASRNPRDFKPITLPVRVANLFDAKFILSGHLAEKLPIDMGRSAVLVHKNVHIVVTSRTGPHFAPQLFQAAGIDPFAASVLIAKSPCGFRAAYADRAKQIFVARAPGCAPADFWTRPFTRIPRPLWPWDEMEWTAK